MKEWKRNRSYFIGLGFRVQGTEYIGPYWNSIGYIGMMSGLKGITKATT